MFIKVSSKPGVYFKFNNPSSRLNLANVDLIHIYEKEMFIKDGVPIPNFRYPGNFSESGRRPAPERALVKIIELKKWQAQTNFSPEDLVIYFTPEGVDEFKRITAIIDRQTL